MGIFQVTVRPPWLPAESAGLTGSLGWDPCLAEARDTELGIDQRIRALPRGDGRLGVYEGEWYQKEEECGKGMGFSKWVGSQGGVFLLGNPLRVLL